MKSLRPYWSWQWMMFGLLLGLGALAMLEPDTAEPVRTMIGLGGIGCVLWLIWKLIQYD